MKHLYIKYKNSLLILSAAIVVLTALALPFILLNNKIYPRVHVANAAVGNLTSEEALQKLQQIFPTPENITLQANDTEFTIPTSEIGVSYEYDETIKNAFSASRTGGSIQTILGSVLFMNKEYSVPLVLQIDELQLNEYLSVIADDITNEPIYPTVQLEGNVVVVQSGTEGTTINIPELQEKIISSLQNGKNETITITTQIVDPTISKSEARVLQERAENILESVLILETESESFEYTDNDLLSFLAPNSNYNTQHIDFIVSDLSSVINREPTNSVFVYEQGKVVEFAPAQEGLTVNKQELSTKIAHALAYVEANPSDEISVEIPLTKVQPDITTAEVNDLGINERIGVGNSRFAGSISSRIHNIGLGSSKFNGVLVAPGEVLSFNETIGDISTLTGYKQSYIIQDGKTILGDGGGVCQVSTTLFRAALDAGLPIVNRRAHSYRVTYYEQDSLPGLDATIYSPTTDFKFKNDTANHILIQTLFDPTNATLSFELYGTDDGREVTLTKPVVTSQSPPPEPHYQDDPTLPTGTVKQIDWAAWGAKVQFDYTVTRKGETLQDETFYSNYRPWQAKYLRGTGPTT